ncbi:MAG: 4Fe-4S dicluster domain-containing protein [Lentisphaeria bacterium]|nr:4Fe-4S dicluster domain-containing protein [Lentisphaeria bacterium]
MPKESYPELNQAECKGCRRCVAACPAHVLFLSETHNARGYRVAAYAGSGCVGCGQCFYACPEPHTIRVHVIKDKKS